VHASAKLFARTRRKLHYVYSLFRATRVSPESPIDPAQQLAFYVLGIGAPTPGRTSWWQRAKGIQQGYGGGITKKIVDCHVAILGVWRPGEKR
jgi:hypothetical protein